MFDTHFEFFRYITPEDDQNFLHAFQLYLNARSENNYEILKTLEEEEFEYLLDKIYIEEKSKNELKNVSEIAFEKYPQDEEIFCRYFIIFYMSNYDEDVEKFLLKYKDIFSSHSVHYHFCCVFFYLNSGKREEAREHSKILMDMYAPNKNMDNDYYDFFLGMAMTCMDYITNREAIFYFELLEKLFELKTEDLVKFAYCNYYNEEYFVAIKYYKKYLDIYPYDEHIWVELGKSQHYNWQYEDAIESLEMALALNSNNFIALRELAFVYEGLEMMEKAIACLEKCVSKKEENSNYYTDLYDLGIFYFISEKYDIAKEIFSKISENDIRYVSAARALVDIILDGEFVEGDILKEERLKYNVGVIVKRDQLILIRNLFLANSWITNNSRVRNLIVEEINRLTKKS